MPHLLLVSVLSFSLFYAKDVAALTPLISSAHEGSFECRCTHTHCSTSADKVVKIQISASEKLIQIENDGVIYTGHPIKQHNPETQMTSYVNSGGGSVHFDKDNLIYFGIPKLWTCVKK